MTVTPDGFRIDYCRSCAATIVWAETREGKSTPVDAAPTEDGNTELNYAAGKVRAAVHSQPPLGMTHLRKPHFVSCPDAKEWRARA